MNLLVAEKLSSDLKKKLKKKRDNFHSFEFIKTVEDHALRIAMDSGEKVDKILLRAIIYLYFYPYALNPDNLRTYLFRGQIAATIVPPIIDNLQLSPSERALIIESVSQNFFSYPFKQLFKANNIYIKIIQDAILLSLFDFYEQNKLTHYPVPQSLLELFFNLGETQLPLILNFPQLAEINSSKRTFYQEYTNKISQGLAHKSEQWLLKSAEDKLIKFLLPLIPSWLETYHLTLMTIAWCLMSLAAGYFAQTDLRWFGLVGLAITLQYLTDLMDGNIGRARNTGLVIWGFFMDHFLDYIFLISVIATYFFITPPELHWALIALMVATGSLMFVSIVTAALTYKVRTCFKGIGVTEIRPLVILVPIVIAFTGTFLLSLLPYITIGLFLLLIVVAYQSHQELWKIDMENKQTEI